MCNIGETGYGKYEESRDRHVGGHCSVSLSQPLHPIVDRPGHRGCSRVLLGGVGTNRRHHLPVSCSEIWSQGHSHSGDSWPASERVGTRHLDSEFPGGEGSRQQRTVSFRSCSL